VNLLQPPVAFAAEIIDLAVETSNQIHCFLNRRTKLVRLALPPPDAVDLCNASAHLRFDLLTKLAFRTRRNCLHDELHAARLANAVLLGTVLAEMAPLPIAAREAMLVVEAHVSDYKSWGIYLLEIY
jgi:hypothetical protein